MVAYAHSKHIFFYILLGLLFMACQNRSENCLDPFATNYDVTADDPCPDCCTAQKLTINLRMQLDSMSFAIDSAYSDGAGDTILLNQIEYVLSQFELTDETDAIIPAINRITTDDYDIPSDFMFINSSNANQDVLEYRFEGMMKNLRFKMGLADIISSGNFNVDDENYQAIRDSLFDAGISSFNSMKLNYLNQDSVAFSNVINGLDQYQFEFPLDTFRIRGQSLSLTLNFNLDSLWRDVSLYNDDDADIQGKFISNLPSSISLN